MEADQRTPMCMQILCWSLKDNAKPIVNRKERIKKHLVSCEYFWTKYGEEAEEILRNCDVDEEPSPIKYIRLDS